MRCGTARSSEVPTSIIVSPFPLPSSSVHGPLERNGRRVDPAFVPEEFLHRDIARRIDARPRQDLAHRLQEDLQIHRSEPFSTYQTSISNFCSQDRLLRPFTWTQPVMPGLTSCRRACRGV